MIKQIIDALAATNSRLEKEAILRANSDNQELFETFKLALDPHTQFYQRKIPDYTTTGENLDLLTVYRLLREYIVSRKVTGNEAIKSLSNLLAALSEDDAKVLAMVIQKDLRCGVNASTANKIWKDMIPEYPVLLASAFSEKLVNNLPWDKGVYVQLKSDGMRVNVIVKNGKVEVRSRNGKLLECSEAFEWSIGTGINNAVIDGELMVVDPLTGKFLDRKTGNGICNKAVKGTISATELSMLHLVAWDLIDLESFTAGKSDVPYHTRLWRLQELVKDQRQHNPDLALNFSVIKTELIHSYEEAALFYRKMVSTGEEGAILKTTDLEWANTRSKNQIKMKEEHTCELRVVEAVMGTGRNAQRLGALQCVTECGKLSVSVGSGFSDEQRDEFYQNPPEIITVAFNKVINERGSDSFSLFLPVFVEDRSHEKNRADTLKDILTTIDQNNKIESVE